MSNKIEIDLDDLLILDLKMLLNLLTRIGKEELADKVECYLNNWKQMMNSNEILKQIDNLINENENILGLCFDKESYFKLLEEFFHKTKEIMKNYEKVLEIEHFKQTEL